MGLSIVKRVLDLYSGEIWLESEVLKGTTFYFTLPKIS
jgi:signal transduction histidine kinase